ncbi:MAG: TIGR04282 family arsenosugar biosynthesis glycosyltransferase [Chitinophagaceae bacterium]|nr:TIGR04282 family arsenosugar biosynthesis glycosyltransferase [Chitinophagaceae bacterium]
MNLLNNSQILRSYSSFTKGGSGKLAALIIFVRNPVLGKVKSRLAETLGAENAVKIYKKLLQHTHDITKDIVAEKYIFYADYINNDDIWENEIYYKERQSGLDLGERMKNAFELLFDKGYKEIIIIGSDCYELKAEILLTAFDRLRNVDIVIGPATDGGYYLLGMNILIPQLFESKNWSSNNVLSETITQINTYNYSLYRLQTLNDVDEEKDVTFSY